LTNNISDCFINKKRLGLVEDLCGKEELIQIQSILNKCFEDILFKKNTKTSKLLSFISDLDNILEVDDSKLDLYNNVNRKEFIINNDETLKEAINIIKDAKILGFDSEQKPVFKKGVPASKIAIIQLCDANNSYIFQVQQINNIDSLLDILSNEEITKVGIGLKNDKQVLYNEFKCTLNAFIDFGILFKSKLFSSNELGAKKACLLFLNKKMQKSKNISRSNWENKELTLGQIKYANEDASCVYDAFSMMLIKYEFLLDILPLWFQEEYNNSTYDSLLEVFVTKGY